MIAGLEWAHFIGSVSEFLGMEPDMLKRETSFYDDLGLDSLGLFSPGIHLIRIYGIRLPLAVMPTIRTIGDAYDSMKSHESEASPKDG